MMMRLPDTMGVEDPRAMAMATSSPRSYSSSPASRRTVRPRPSAAWRPGQVRPSRSVRRTGGPSPATSRALLSMPGLRLSRRRSPRRRPPGGQWRVRAVSVAGRTPAIRVRRTAGSPVEVYRTVGRGLEPRHDAAAGGPARMPALWGGWGPAPDGPAGMMAVRPGRAGAVRSVSAHGLAVAGDGYDAVQLASTLELNGQWLPSGLSDFTLV